jgi:hypothetical protein
MLARAKIGELIMWLERAAHLIEKRGAQYTAGSRVFCRERGDLSALSDERRLGQDEETLVATVMGRAANGRIGD